MTEMPEINPKARYTYPEAAKIIGVKSLKALRLRIKNNEITPIILGPRTKRISGSQLIAYLRRCGEEFPV